MPHRVCWKCWHKNRPKHINSARTVYVWLGVTLTPNPTLILTLTHTGCGEAEKSQSLCKWSLLLNFHSLILFGRRKKKFDFFPLRKRNTFPINLNLVPQWRHYFEFICESKSSTQIWEIKIQIQKFRGLPCVYEYV